MSDYAANGGTNGTPGNFGAGSFTDAPITLPPLPPVTTASIHSGLSTTILLGEKCLNRADLNNPEADDDCGWTAGNDPNVIRWGYSQPVPDYNIPTEEVYDPRNNYYCMLFGSSHAGSSNYAMCDGSVRPIVYNISLAVFEKLCSIDWRNSPAIVSNNGGRAGNFTPIPMSF